jgi:hypothetical protein
MVYTWDQVKALGTDLEAAGVDVKILSIPGACHYGSAIGRSKKFETIAYLPLCYSPFESHLRTNQLIDRHIQKFEPAAMSLQCAQNVISPFKGELIEHGWVCEIEDDDSGDELVEHCFSSILSLAIAEATKSL